MGVPAEAWQHVTTTLTAFETSAPSLVLAGKSGGAVIKKLSMENKVFPGANVCIYLLFLGLFYIQSFNPGLVFLCCCEICNQSCFLWEIRLQATECMLASPRGRFR